MQKNDRFSVIGGDKRMVYLANLLSDKKFYVNTYGLNPNELSSSINIADSINEAIYNSDIIITPLPFSSDNQTINCNIPETKILIKELFDSLNKDQLIFGGYINKDIVQLAIDKGINIFDYYEREELIIQNCIPTAEGAIKIAIEELPSTLFGSKCLILGFGRIGKILSKMLDGIGADVYVEARKIEDLAWINSLGYKSINLNDLENHIDSIDIIFNTVPFIILDENMLKKLKKDCFIIDLASKPFGVDFVAAEKLNIKTNLAQSLPGKVAPLSAAKYIKEAIFNIINERRENK